MERQTIRWAAVAAAMIGLSVCAQQATKVAPSPTEPPEGVTGKAAPGKISPRKAVPLPAEKPDPPATTNPLAQEREKTDNIINNVLPQLREKIGPPVRRQGTTLETDTSYVPP
jgi:hypothetical protein